MSPAAPSFPQREGASTRDIVLFELVRARAAVLAALQGLPPGLAEQPLSAGQWSPREVVLHLVTRDRARLEAMEAALRGEMPSWKNLPESAWAEINERTLAPLRHLGWEQALRRLHATRDELMSALERVPGEPASAWDEDHPLGWMLRVLATHDRHHADHIKRWRLARGA